MADADTSIPTGKIQAKPKFPTEALIPFNLACYRSVSGMVAEAKELLAEAFTLDASLRLTALDDQDLVVGVLDSIVFRSNHAGA